MANQLLVKMNTLQKNWIRIQMKIKKIQILQNLPPFMSEMLIVT